MHRLGVRIITGFVTFILGLLAWMIFVFASPAQTLDTQDRAFSSQRVERTDVPPPPPPPAKPYGCRSRHQ